jgi:hypothetical protein
VQAIFVWERLLNGERHDHGEGGAAGFTLIEKMFEHLDSTKRDFFHHFLKAFIKSQILPHRYSSSVDESSLTCCVLYILARVPRDLHVDDDSDKAAEGLNEPFDDPFGEFSDEDADEDTEEGFGFEGFEEDSNEVPDHNGEPSVRTGRKEWWEKYIEIFRDELNTPSARGLLPLSVALRMGYQWSPVIRDMIETEPSVVEKMDSTHRLPLFLIAATANTERRGCSLPGDYARFEYSDLNAVNNTFALLRLQPGMLDRVRGVEILDGKDSKRVDLPTSQTTKKPRIERSSIPQPPE